MKFNYLIATMAVAVSAQVEVGQTDVDK
jgi:hypothetical protein